jgi:hypothetical protein
MERSNITIGVTVVLVILLAWGVVGSSQAAKIGVDCDIGAGKDGSVFCWTWHKNIIGQVGDEINKFVNG